MPYKPIKNGLIKLYFSILNGCLHTKYWLILSKKQDPDPFDISDCRVKIMNNSGFFTAKKSIFALFLGVFCLTPISVANAGFLSFLNNLFNDESVSREEKIINSQNMSLLEAALNVDPNPAKGGGGITVVEGIALLPDSGPSGTIADIEESSISSDAISLYVVREGDSLSQIAKMFSVSTETVIWANDIKRGDMISPGETLIILPISGVRHTVAKDDTLQGIAKKYGGGIDEILDFNGFSEDTVLSIGEVVVIPDGEISNPKYSSSNRVVRGSKGPSLSGYYIKPINGGIKTQGLHGYGAVDLAVPFGTPIFAAASGDVIISKNSGWNGGYGKYIVIRHPNGTQTLYSHNSNNIVVVGNRVVQGQIIGYIGSTGKSTGPHVHFEVRGAQNPF